MSQPMGSTDNEELVRSHDKRAKDQAEFGYVSGAEQMTNEEREHQRNIESNALENAGDPRLVEERIIPEGMGGAGGGDVDDVGDVGFPEEAGGGPISAQQRTFVDQPGVATEGMGGAGGGDMDDVGDVGYPDGAITSAEPGRGATTGEADERFAQAWKMAGGDGGDVETMRTMGSGDTGITTNRDMADPGGDAAAIDAGFGPDSDVGAPWDKVDDAARLGANPKPRT